MKFCVVVFAFTFSPASFLVVRIQPVFIFFNANADYSSSNLFAVRLFLREQICNLSIRGRKALLSEPSLILILFKIRIISRAILSEQYRARPLTAKFDVLQVI